MIARLSIAEQYKEIFLAKVAMRPTLSQKMFVWGMLCAGFGGGRLQEKRVHWPGGARLPYNIINYC